MPTLEEIEHAARALNTCGHDCEKCARQHGLERVVLDLCVHLSKEADARERHLAPPLGTTAAGVVSRADAEAARERFLSGETMGLTWEEARALEQPVATAYGHRPAGLPLAKPEPVAPAGEAPRRHGIPMCDVKIAVDLTPYRCKRPAGHEGVHRPCRDDSTANAGVELVRVLRLLDGTHAVEVGTRRVDVWQSEEHARAVADSLRGEIADHVQAASEKATAAAYEEAKAVCIGRIKEAPRLNVEAIDAAADCYHRIHALAAAKGGGP